MISGNDIGLAINLAAAVGAGVMTGVFFVFSVAVMSGLGRRPHPEGMAAMQAINVTIVNPAFLVVFLGTGVACLLAYVLALRAGPPGTHLLLAGAALYLVGGVGVTIAFNVPMNNALARTRVDDPQSAAQWDHYLRLWTAWNHLRTAACLAATVALVLARIH